MRKKSLAVLLVLAMLLGLFPATALADEPGAGTPVVQAVEGDSQRYGWTAFQGEINADNLIGAYNTLAAGIGKAETSIAINQYSLTVTELNTVMEAVLSDYPEYFWIGKKSDEGISYYSYAVTNNTVTFVKPTYNTHKEDRNAVDSAVSALLDGLSGTDYDKALEIHDRLAEHVTYGSDPDDQNIYSALVTRTTVCAGYARAYQYLLNKAGIKAWYVSGTSKNPTTGVSENHAWNAIYLDDDGIDAWYYVDVTWDDQENTLFHAYFLQNSARMADDHTAAEGFYADHLPTTGTADNYYFTQPGNGTVISTFDVDTVADGMKRIDDYTYTGHFYVTGDVTDFVSALFAGEDATADETKTATDNQNDLVKKLSIPAGQYSLGCASIGREVILTLTTENVIPSITISDPDPITYDGEVVTAGTKDTSAPDLIYTYTGSDGTVTVNWYADNSGTKAEDALPGAPKNAGTYWIGVSASDVTGEVTKQFTISPAEYTYNGPTDVTTTVTVNTAYPSDATAKATGVALEEVTGTLAWFTDSGCQTPASGTFDTVGPMTLYWKFTPGENQPNYVTDPETGNVTFTVSALPAQTVTFSGLSDDAVSKTYGESGFTYVATSNASGATITYASSDPTVATVDSNGQVTIKGAGETTITATAAATGSYAEGKATYTLTVSPKSITATPTVADKIYDGSTNATVSVSFSDSVNLTPNTDYTVSASFTDKNVGTGKAVNVTVKLTGDAANNYTLTSTASATADITAKEISVTGATVADKIYDGTTAATVTGVSFNDLVSGESLTLGTDYTVSAAFTSENASNSANATVTVTLIPTGPVAKNYTLASGGNPATAIAKITPAVPTVNAQANHQVKVGSTLEVFKAAVPATATGVNSATVNGTVTWYSDSNRQTEAQDNDVSGLSAGAQKVLYWTFQPSDSNYASVDGQTTFAIIDGDPQNLTFADASVEKTFGDPDFTHAATNSVTSGGGKITYESSNTGVATVNESTGTVTIVGVGTTTITATAAAVPGQYAEGNASYTLTVNKKTISITGATATDRDYIPNNTSVDIRAVTFSGATLSTDDYTVTGVMDDANAGNGKDVTVTVTLIGNAAKNYQLSSSTYRTTVNINKINWTGTAGKTVNILKNSSTAQSGSLTAADFFSGSAPEGAVITTVTPLASGTIMSSVFVAGGTLSYTSNTNIGEAAAETYTVTITSTNYNDISATLKFQPTDKTPVIISGLTAASGLVYNSSAQKGYSGTPSYSPGWSGTPTVTYYLSDGTTKTTAANSGAASEGAAPVYAGSYRVVIAIPDTDSAYTGSVTLPFQIAKKSVTVAPKSFSITKGDTIPTFALTYTGLLGSDTLTPSATPDFTCYETGTTTAVSNATPAGTYTITWTNARDTTFTGTGSGNYTVATTPTGTLTITEKSTTPVTPVVPSTPSTSRDDDDDDDDGDYSVSVPSSTSVEGGSVSVSPRSADKGDTVSITVRPKTGYVLDKLTVTTRTGAQVELTRKSETRYTFIMPAGSISVQVSFIPEEQAAEMDFADVPESFWAVNEIQWAYDNGFMNGTSAVSFNPGGTVNRQQVWMILARMAGADPASMAEAKAWAVANGISDGTTPTGAVTRQQLVALLYRFAVQNGYDVSGKADLSIYPDAASVAAYASDAMSWAVANGIIGGTTAGTLNPAGDSNRAQLAVILWRFYQTTAG